MKGKLVIFSAPSGAGKTTIVQALLKAEIGLEFSISACSRDKRSNEVDGKDYYFLGLEGFKQKIEADELLEWEEVYKDHFYGTLRSELNRIWGKGLHVIFDVDVYGGITIKEQFGDRALAVFVMPPSIEMLEERLRGRSTDSEENIQKRMSKAKHEISMAEKFDSIIVNDELETAIEEAKDLVNNFLTDDG